MDDREKRFFALILILAVTLAGARLAAKYHASQRRHPDWSSVPYKAGEWIGQDTAIDPIFGMDPADTSLVRLFHESGEPPIVLYIGFYGDLGGVMQFHSPEICYPSQGWALVSSNYSQPIRYRDRSLRPQEAIVEKEGSQRIVVWWYSSGSKAFENRIRYLYTTLMIGSLKGRTDGSLVRIEAMIGKDGVDAARNRLLEFERQILPGIDQALP